MQDQMQRLTEETTNKQHQMEPRFFAVENCRHKQQWNLQTERQGPTLGATECCLV